MSRNPTKKFQRDIPRMCTKPNSRQIWYVWHCQQTVAAIVIALSSVCCGTSSGAVICLLYPAISLLWATAA